MSDSAPDLYLDWEERLVGRGIRWWRKLRKKRNPGVDPSLVATLKNEEQRLTIVAQLFAGGPLHLRPAEAGGGLRGRVLLIPAMLAAGPTADANAELYFLRCVIEGTRSRLGKKSGRTALTGEAIADEVNVLAGVADALAWLREDFEGFAARFEIAALWVKDDRKNKGLSPRAQAIEELRMQVLAGEAIDDLVLQTRLLMDLDDVGEDSAPIALWGGALGPADISLAEQLDASDEIERAAGEGKIETELEAPPKDHIERAFVEEESDAEVMPMHTFEKVDCLDDFNGNMRRTDGSDELEDHLEALDEVDLRHIIRGGEAAEAIYHAEIDGLSMIPDVDHIAPGEKGVRYDEWDVKAGRYRRDWTTVYPSVAELGDDGWAIGRLEELSSLRKVLLQKLERERHTREWVGRQKDGDEVDLDAVIECYGDRRAGRPGDQRLYRRNPRRRRDIATTVLIDVSLSSDGWVENRRVLDVSRDAVLLLGEVAEALGDRFEVLAFASNTRNHCRVWRVKGWKDSWRVGRGRLGALIPTGYTRIGPALRHASDGLNRQKAERKLLLLMTDGKPNDYDRYEGAHGIGDVRQATREAARDGIEVHALGIDPSAARTLPVMFGIGGSQVLRHLSDLPEALLEAYAQATGA